MMLALMGALVAVLMLCRVPVAITFLVPSLIYIGINPGLTIDIALQRVTSGMNLFVLLAIPLFILTGNVMNFSGITERIFESVQALLGHTRGGLGYVNIGASVVFSGMSGAAVADTAALGQIEYNAMRKAGYDERLSIGITGASSTIGPIFPPSNPAVIYGVAAGVSIGGLFLAGIVPAILIAIALGVMVYYYARKQDLPRTKRSSLAEIAKLTAKAFPALLTPVIILVGIVGGFFTPTEAAGVTVVYAVVISVVLYRSLTLRNLYKSLLSTAETTASIVLIIGTASLFGWILAREQAPQAVAQLLLGFTDSAVVFLLLVNILLLVLGMVLEPAPIILIMVPVLLPVVEAFEISPLHFGIVMILNLMIGLLTPPVGNVLYVLNSVTGVSFINVVRGVAPFLVPLLISLLLVTFVPSISLSLPRLFGLG